MGPVDVLEGLGAKCQSSTNTGEPAAAGWPRQLPYTPEDQSQEQDRQPLTYDYNCKGTMLSFMLILCRGRALT
jgi:hypothetical protein